MVRNNRLLQLLLIELKHYITCQKDYLQITFLEKLIVIGSTFVLAVILTLLGMTFLFYFSFSILSLLAPLVGGFGWGAGIVAIIYALAGVLVYGFRQRLIVRPIIRFFSNIFLK